MNSSSKDLLQTSQISAGDSAATLRLKFLTPLVAMIVFIVLILAVSLFYFESESQSYGLIHKRLTRTQSVAKDFFEESVRNDVNALSAILAAMGSDEKLAEVFVTYDKSAILKYTDNMYKALNRDYNVTHFYFTMPDRVNLLRVHAPERYGDRIDRETTLRAQQNDTIAYGIELGVLGTFTLRVVSPWRNKKNGHLIGYIELGMEIDHVINRLMEVFGYDVVVVIHKKFLDREKWESGMRTLGRDANWDRYKTVVLSREYSGEMPSVLRERFEQGVQGHRNDVLELEEDGFAHWLLTIPIEDVKGRHVAEMTLLADVSSEMDVAQSTAIVVGATVFVLGGLLIIFFSWQANRIGQRIERDEEILKQLATHDSLTGLYTRRVFHEKLDAELNRSLRFDHPLSLLIIDIDFFKKVNDSYGHQAGDDILKKLSERLIKEVRSVDYVCRYGGEEMAIILPETDVMDAQHTANRIKNAVSALPYDIGNENRISVTVSIGVSNCPLHADSDTFLIAAADRALYEAKAAGRNRVCICTESEELSAAQNT